MIACDDRAVFHALKIDCALYLEVAKLDDAALEAWAHDTYIAKPLAATLENGIHRFYESDRASS